jgi:hypothetical protein
MKKIKEFEEHLSLLAAVPLAELQAMEHKDTTLHVVVPRILRAFDTLWLEATQLSLPLDGGSQMYSSQCSDLPLYPNGENH